MKTRTLDKLYPKLKTFGGLRQGTLKFAMHNLRMKRRYGRNRNWRLFSFRHPVTGKMWHCIGPNKKLTTGGRAAAQKAP